jgi:hypothetical protein
MRAILVLIGLGFATAAAAEPTWAPFVSGAIYHYAGTFKDKHYQDGFIVKSRSISGHTVFYFAEEKTPDRPVQTLFTHFPGLGAYEDRADGVYTLDAYSLADLDGVSPAEAQLLLPKHAPVGTHVHLHGRLGETDLTVLAVEDVTVPAGTFRGCLKVELNDEGEKGTAWLAPGVGLVQWLRATGRRDVLVEYRRPPAK